MDFVDLSKNELFELLFGSSYSARLTAYRTVSGDAPSRQRLKGEGLKRLNDLIDVAGSSSDEINLENVAANIDIYLAGKEGSLFAINFPINGEVNCLGKANLYVLVLKYLDRDEALKKIRVKYVPNHVWLSSADGVEVNNPDCCVDSDNSRGLNALVAANLYSVAFHSKKLALERKDATAYVDYVRFRSAARVLDADLVKYCESGKSVKRECSSE